MCIVLALVSIQLLAQCVYVAIHPILFEKPVVHCLDGSYPECETLTFISVVNTFLAGVVLTILAFKLKIVVDACGVKRVLKSIGRSVLLGVATYTALLIFLDKEAAQNEAVFTVVPVLTVHMMMCNGILWPLVRTIYEKAPSRDEMLSPARLTVLEKFLLTDTGFQAFRAHLIKEFAIESLMSVE